MEDDVIMERKKESKNFKLWMKIETRRQKKNFTKLENF